MSKAATTWKNCPLIPVMLASKEQKGLPFTRSQPNFSGHNCDPGCSSRYIAPMGVINHCTGNIST